MAETPAANVDPQAALTFERDIRPILKTYCLDCHGAEEKHEGNLDLRLRHLLVQGGDSGAGITPGDPAASFLLERVTSGEMPPGDAKVPADKIAILKEWIAAGAPTAREEPEVLDPGIGITPEEREFWAYQPIRRPEVPSIADASVRTPIDALLLARLREKGLAFSPEAEMRELIRRLSLDLTGLPPTPREVDRFVADDSPDAYEQLVERLLASPQYGERWGRHWLDAAGYADSDGYTAADPTRAYSYKFRDYVIRAFNADKPFDQFITEQLAGDELVPQPHANLTREQIDTLAATGFLRMAADGTSAGGVDVDVARNAVVADTIKIVSTSLLGLSVACAQCHDHRYDPIPQEDYYRLRAVFEPAYDWKAWKGPSERLVSLYTDADRAAANAIEEQVRPIAEERNRKEQEYMAAALDIELARYEEPLRTSLRTAYNTPDKDRTEEQKALLTQNPSVNISPGTLYQYNQKAADELKGYDARIAEMRAKKPVEDYVSILNETPGHVPETMLFHRGDHRQPKHAVAPGGLTVTSPPGERLAIPADDPAVPTTGRRLAFAKWLTDGKNPLVARVLVNRVWLNHFGRGIVGTPGDFGVLGEKPSNPELLDWLADEFMAQGWSLKHLHRLIVMSTAYRQTSMRDAAKEQIDPDNVLYWRAPIRRLEAEAIRDAILAVSGAINPQMFGAPVPVKEDDVGQIVVGIDNKVDANRPGAEIPLGGAEFRRAVYIQVRRSQPLAFTTAFDAPVMETNCERRTSSTAATQSLMLMNSDFILEQSGVFARSVIDQVGHDTQRQIEWAWERAYSRPPSEAEITASIEFMSRQTQLLAARPPVEGQPPIDPALQSLTNFCQVLLSSNEFLYIQ